MVRYDIEILNACHLNGFARDGLEWTRDGLNGPLYYIARYSVCCIKKQRGELKVKLDAEMENLHT